MDFFRVLIVSLLVCSCNSEDNVCGRSDQSAGLIIGGSPVSRGKWPWIVALFKTTANESKFFCGGTLISNKHVVTAAHCIHPKFRAERTKTNDIVAYLGRYELSKPFERGSHPAFPQKVLIHEDWNHETYKYDADIALIFLESAVTFSAYISPICLYSSTVTSSSSAGIVAGWGQATLETHGKPSNTPKQVEVAITSNDVCFLENYQLTFISSDRTFCAKGEESSGPCLGDSGSGLFVRGDNKWFLRGIVSASLLRDQVCDVTKHSIYTNFLSFTSWIEEKSGIKQQEVAKQPIDIITRAMWNAAPPKPNILYLNPPSKRVMISQTVTEDCVTRAECIDQLQNTQRAHQSNPPNFNDIYCNFFIGADDLILEGRGWTVRGEHTVSATKSHNEAVCVAFIGHFKTQPPKQTEIDAFFKLLDHGVAIGMLDKDYVINAQRDFHASESPGDAFYNIIKTWPRFRNSI